MHDDATRVVLILDNCRLKQHVNPDEMTWRAPTFLKLAGDAVLGDLPNNGRTDAPVTRWVLVQW
jgi:hypothetical protein